MYVAKTRSSQYIHEIRLDAEGHMVGRSIFADLNEGSEPGIPDGLKVDSIGRVYCTGPGGIWVMAPNGRRIILIPHVAAGRHRHCNRWALGRVHLP